MKRSREEKMGGKMNSSDSLSFGTKEQVYTLYIHVPLLIFNCITFLLVLVFKMQVSYNWNFDLLKIDCLFLCYVLDLIFTILFILFHFKKEVEN